MTFLLGFGLFSEGLWRVGTQKIEDNWVLGIHMDVSENSGFSLQIIHFNRVFHYKPSIFGVPLFLETPILSLRKNHQGHTPTLPSKVEELSKVRAVTPPPPPFDRDKLRSFWKYLNSRAGYTPNTRKKQTLGNGNVGVCVAPSRVVQDVLSTEKPRHLRDRSPIEPPNKLWIQEGLFCYAEIWISEGHYDM